MTPESPGSAPREGAGSIAKAALLYFAVVFAAGFLLGTVRTLWIAPRLGTRVAELAETPAIAEYFASRDPVAGTVYEVSLLVFAAMPALVRRNLSP